MSTIDEWSAEQADEFFMHMLMMIGPPQYGYEGTKHLQVYWDAAATHSGGKWPSYSDYMDWFESLSSRA